MSANFSPVMEGYSGVEPFRFWCQKVLPLTYDDSLSYYELLCKVVNYVNHLIEDVSAAEDNVTALKNAYDELEDYVNDYFDNLDVQDEINAKLDAMVTDGTLTSIISPLVTDMVPDLVGEWLTENVDPVGSAVVVDSSLLVSGAAADAKVVGTKFTSADYERKIYDAIINKTNGAKDINFAGLVNLTTGKWTSVSNGTCCLFPVNSGDSVYIKAGPSRTTRYGIFTDFTGAVGDVAAPLSSASGFTSAIELAVDTTATFTVPSDGKYLYLANTYSGNSYMPAELKINNSNAFAGIYNGLAKSARFYTYAESQPITTGSDLNDFMFVGTYRLGYGSNYTNCPIGEDRKYMFVLGNAVDSNIGNGCQILYGTESGEIWLRARHDSTWDSWTKVQNSSSAKMTAGMNPYRKAIDHGGFFGSNSQYENSPLAFANSAKEGIVFHNLDICFSSDGVPFVAHEPSVTDKNGVSFNINNTTAANIKTHSMGDANYSWALQTLYEAHKTIQQLGGVIDMIDVTAADNDTQAGFCGTLPTYYKQCNIHPTWTNMDYSAQRNAFLATSTKYGIYFVCNSSASISSAMTYATNNPSGKYCFSVAYSNDSVASAFDAVMDDVVDLADAIYVYTYNKSNISTVPAFADGVVSEDCNVNYEQCKSNNVL